jgi:[ribosomal protein S5]-alanine N-acetyltransferase
VQEIRHFPELETSRLRLRELHLNDAPFILNLYSDENVCKYLYDDKLYTNIDEAKDFIEWNTYYENKNHNRWGIIRKADGVIVGTVGFHSWDRYNHIAEIGYDLAEEFWRKGYMSEAVDKCLNHGFRSLGLNRIHAYIAPENLTSIRLLEKLGFKREGIFRDKHYYMGEYHDLYCYSLLKREWE